MTKISLAEPVSELRRIKIVECGEPLIDFLSICPDLLLDHPRFDYRRETLARKSVAEMLCQANAFLMSLGYRLAIVEGWRPSHIQRRMYRGTWNRFKERHPEWSDVTLRRVVNRYTAPLHGRVPPPHTTGGAVDLVLANIEGNVQDHCSPYDWHNPICFKFDAPGLSDAAMKTRGLLARALVPAGLTNYPSEYWHWTFGDQGWAYRGGHPNAIYGPVAPPGYEPEPSDISDMPLILRDLPRERQTLKR